MKSLGGTILVVDDDPDIREVVKDRLESLGCRVLAAANGKEGLELLEKQSPQLVLLDIEMPDMNGLDVLKQIRAGGNEATVVMITAYGTIERAVQAMKQGAYDFIPKPFEPEQIALTVEKALEREKLKREVEILSGQISERYHLVTGKSAGMKEAIGTARKAADSKATVLLLGESGTGKEIFARAIHNWSDRRREAFIAINCVGLSKELLESELFGHEKGAFTGAHQLKRGKIELAHGGTVFLDEIGDISADVQTKLLRFLQEREFERLGGTKSIAVDVRVIGATNRDLDRAVREGRFREDLYYRLNVIPITLPPLRDRKEDIPLLADYFMQRFAKEAKKKFTEITKEAKERLLTYDWPGNVRELANVMERAIVLGQGSKMTLRDLSPRIAATEPEAPSDSLLYREAIDGYRRQVILRALSQTRGNRAAAAKALGLQRTYLSRLIKTLQIE
ncbi:MAG: sigma-54-dependent Fis family transcriptional regulator [Deltaproteobacteria bacterium]|nr:sigma-54-dependent Fis family transcriptional regulator [Deltaproteobacteria bacterium]